MRDDVRATRALPATSNAAGPARIRTLGARLVFAMAVVTAGCGQPAEPPPSTPVLASLVPSALDRGKLLVSIGGCHDCHTPKTLGPKGPEPDMARMLSGHPEELTGERPFAFPKGSSWTAATNDHLTAWSGPWGVSFAANLTPDPTTGLRSGVWTEEIFVKAMRTGKHMGTSRDILPPMPWPALAQLNDDDLKAIWGYLGTIPPIVNHVPEPIPPNGPPR